MAEGTNSDETVWMPETVGLPPAILYWEADEIIPVFIMFGLGLFLSQMVVGIICICVYFYIFSKFREILPHGFIVNILYFLGLLKIKNTAIYIAREFQE